MGHEDLSRVIHPVDGRGAVSNLPGRFDRRPVEPFDDGWGTGDPPVSKIATEAIPEASRTILSTNDSPDIPFDVSINPYKGCEHGCVYCFARPSHAFLDLSPGLDFETKIFVKPHAPDLLRKALRKKNYVCKPIALGTNTDPYQPLERNLEITRKLLEVFRDYRHPFSIVTKSALVLRDLDLIAPMAADGMARVYLSITTLDRRLARRMEPRAAAPQRRLATLRALSDAGVPAGVMASPMIPGINDHELENILAAATQAGAGSAAYLLVRLPHEVRPLFVDWLRTHYPDREEKVLGALREMRGGRLNDPRFGSRMRGEGVRADLLDRRFQLACRRLGLNRERPRLDTSAFSVPCAPGEQQSLF